MRNTSSEPRTAPTAVRMLIGLFVAAFALTILALVAAAASNRSGESDELLPGTRIMGIDVGGLSQQEAAARVAPVVRALLSKPVSVYHDGKSWQLIPADIGITPDVEATVLQAWQLATSGGWWDQFRMRLLAVTRRVDVPLALRTNQERLGTRLGRLARQVNKPAVEPRVRQLSTGRLVIEPEVNGVAVDLIQLSARLHEAALWPRGRAVELPTQPLSPKKTARDLERLDIEGVLARFTTRFDPKDENRTHNIRIAAQALDGTVLMPGERFSFNQTVGPRAEAAGFREAPVVLAGQLVPDIGGGVCQVSSTLFNAVLYAEMKIDTRVSHSIPATYVPMGRDATVAYDYLDFEFTNPTDAPVLIHASLSKDKVTVELLGKEKPAVVELMTTIDAVLNPTIEEVMDPTLPKGSRLVERKPVKGYRITLYRVVKEGDRILLKERVGKSYYKPRNGLVRIGTGTARVQLRQASDAD